MIFPPSRPTIDESFAKSLEGHDVDLELLNSVFDPSQEKAVCPACGFEFSTSSLRLS